jgi:hypothetical protein
MSFEDGTATLEIRDPRWEKFMKHFA